MARPFSYGGFNFTWSTSGRLQYQFGNDKYAVGILPVPVTQQSIDAQKNTGAAENNPAFVEALNNLDVAGLNEAIANAQRPITNEASASSGDIVGAQQAAKDDGALNQDPTQPATVLTLDGRIVPAGSPTAPSGASNTTVVNGQTVPATEESGTDAPLKPITQTQATPPYDPNQNAANGTLGSGTFTDVGTLGILGQNGSQSGPNSSPGQHYAAGQLPGAGSGTGVNNLARQSDDNPPRASTPSNPTNTTQVLGATFNSQIYTQPNQLGQYASYTYALSWYLLTPGQYNIFINGQKDAASQWMLLMQSGGAPVAQTTPAANDYSIFTGATPAAPGGRSQFFQVDYYLDDLEIVSKIPLGGTGSCCADTDIKFRVVEPNGITLIDSLYKAVTTLYKQPQSPAAAAPTNNTNATTSIQNPNYPMAQYCMVIHFYGYDAKGNLVTPITGQYSPTGVPKKTDPSAVIEKYYPFIIANLKYRMANKQIEYEITGKPMSHYYNKGTDRGSIPFNFNLSGTTVGQLLAGSAGGSGKSFNVADPGARVAKPNPSSLTATSPATASVINAVAQNITNATASTVAVDATGVDFSLF